MNASTVARTRKNVTKQTPVTLSEHPDKELPSHRLPFVGGVGRDGMGISFWDVPASGGYMGGCITGDALATIYIKHLRTHRAEGGLLQCIVSSMITGYPSADKAEEDARSGQIMGFFSALDRWLSFAATHGAANLDQADMKAVLDRANEGLNLDEKAYMKKLQAAYTEKLQAACAEDAESQLAA